jgi:hypothetical protein
MLRAGYQSCQHVIWCRSSTLLSNFQHSTFNLHTQSSFCFYTLPSLCQMIHVFVVSAKCIFAHCPPDWDTATQRGAVFSKRGWIRNASAACQTPTPFTDREILLTLENFEKISIKKLVTSKVLPQRWISSWLWRIRWHANRLGRQTDGVQREQGFTSLSNVFEMTLPDLCYRFQWRCH